MKYISKYHCTTCGINFYINSGESFDGCPNCGNEGVLFDRYIPEDETPEIDFDEEGEVVVKAKVAVSYVSPCAKGHVWEALGSHNGAEDLICKVCGKEDTVLVH